MTDDRPLSGAPGPTCVARGPGGHACALRPHAVGEHIALADHLGGTVRWRDGDIEWRRVRYARPARAATNSAIAAVQGFTGDSCGSCGSMSVTRNGSCLLCRECGETSGCS